MITVLSTTTKIMQTLGNIIDQLGVVLHIIRMAMVTAHRQSVYKNVFVKGCDGKQASDEEHFFLLGLLKLISVAVNMAMVPNKSVCVYVYT